MNAEYSSITPLPFSTSGSTVCAIKLKSDCVLRSGGTRSAPFCNWEIDLSFNKGEPCNSSRASYRSGRIFASGTGPASYTITGGGGDFSGIRGKLDSRAEIVSRTSRAAPILRDFETEGQICYDDKQTGGSISASASASGSCCTWNGSTCGNDQWCNFSKDRCESNCNGDYIDPSNPPVPEGCCSWYGSVCGTDTYCNSSRSRCEGNCNGSYI